MNDSRMCVLIIRDLESREDVYGKILYDDYLETIPVPNDEVDSSIRYYLFEFCAGCYIRDNQLDKGPLSNEFEGRVAIVAEQAGMKEYSIVVKLLTHSVDHVEILEYYKKNVEWNAALQVSRGFSDPRVLTEPSIEDMKKEIFWNVFKQTFALVSLAVMVSLFVGSLIDDKK